jgi:aspartate aminotransferase
MFDVNSKIKNLRSSETLAIKNRALELKAQGKSIIDLSTGEPDFDTPEHIKAAAQKAMQAGKTKYTAVPGIKELREAVAEKLRRENKVCCDADSVIITNGGKQALQEFFEVFLEPGDEVIVPAPYWVSYPPMIYLARGESVIVSTSADNNYKLTPDMLKAAITPKTRALVLNSPSNPTGACYSAKEYQELAKVIEGKDILVISDEVYEKLCFVPGTFVSFAEAVPSLSDRTVTVNAFSKTYSMTGWRVGYAAGPKPLIAAMGKLQSQSVSNVCSIAQYAALEAVTGPQDFINGMVDKYRSRVHMAADIVKATPGLRLPHLPDGAFYLFINCSEIITSGALAAKGVKDSTTLAAYLLEEAGVACVPGAAFGDDNAIRFSIAAADESIKQGFERIKQALSV